MAKNQQTPSSVEIELVDAELFEENESKLLNGMLGITFAVSVAFLILASSIGEVLSNTDSQMDSPLLPGDSVELTF